MKFGSALRVLMGIEDQRVLTTSFRRQRDNGRRFLDMLDRFLTTAAEEQGTVMIQDPSAVHR